MIVHEESPFCILVIEPDNTNCCSHYDEDCDLVEDKIACYQFRPENGICPYLGD